MRRTLLPILLMTTAVAGGCESHTLGEATRLMQDDGSADARREGIAYLVTHFEAATVSPYTGRYRQIAKSDPDPNVRAMAVRALNICREKSSTGTFIAALDDDSELVRLEGAKALANVPDPAAVPGLLRLLTGRRVAVVEGRQLVTPEDRDVRIAAADALHHYPTLDVEHALVGHLVGTDFGVAWQVHQSLATLTGQDFRYDEAAWLKYLVKS